MKSKKYLVGIVLIVVSIIFQFTGITKGAIGMVVEPVYENVVVEQTEEIMSGSVQTFAVVSGLKAVTAIVEGSEFSVLGVEIEVGDVIEPAYDAIDILWKTSFLSVVILTAFAAYFIIFKPTLLSLIFTAAVVIYGLSLICTLIDVSGPKRADVVSKVIRARNTIISFACIVFIAIPFAISLSVLCSNFVLAEYQAPAIEQLQESLDSLDESVDKLVKLDASEDAGMFDKFKYTLTTPFRLKDNIGDIFDEIENTGATVIAVTPVIIMSQLVAFILIPVGSIYVVWKSCLYMLKLVFEKPVENELIALKNTK